MNPVWTTAKVRRVKMEDCATITSQTSPAPVSQGLQVRGFLIKKQQMKSIRRLVIGCLENNGGRKNYDMVFFTFG